MGCAQCRQANCLCTHTVHQWQLLSCKGCKFSGKLTLRVKIRERLAKSLDYTSKKTPSDPADR